MGCNKRRERNERKKIEDAARKKFIIKKYKFDISNFAFRLLCMNFLLSLLDTADNEECVGHDEL
jgi:hypothetical protein